MARKIGLVPALRGPVRRIAAEHFMNCYVIWKFAENIDGGQAVPGGPRRAASRTCFRESEFYNFPCYPATVPDLAARLADDPKARAAGQVRRPREALDWATNVGFPGYATAAIDEVFNTFVIPTMFARVARGEASPENAVEAAQAQITRIAGRRGRATAG